MNAVQKLSRIALVSREPDRLASFYQSAFGFVRGDERQLAGTALQSLLCIPGAKARLIPLRLGGQTIELLGIDPEGEAYPADVPAWSNLFQHFAIVVSSMSAAYAKLSAQAGWKPISTEGPQGLPASSGGVTAFKFRDPEGHPLELLAFPSGAVPERWQGSDVTGFLGIDHSAISVADTSQSIDFYRRLGLQRSGGSSNTGPEQDKLDGTRGSHRRSDGFGAGRSAASRRAPLLSQHSGPQSEVFRCERRGSNATHPVNPQHCRAARALHADC